MRPKQRREREDPEVSMSPLIDAVFLLLIFFLVATMWKKEKKDIDINLPVSNSAEKLKPEDENVVIGINQESELFLDGVPSSLQQLHEELMHVATTTPDIRIRLDVDEETPFHRVVEIMDLCQFRGLDNIGIRTYDEHYNR